ncbi:MAG: potassium-transporting ATPase subunit KdpA [Kiritimatiellaceae bacterium]|nr:potassium-transporting ATPase subunit KdpA [Kiritimatiellaceae bacterium]
MKTTEWLQVIAFFGALLALSPLLGIYLSKVLDGRPPRFAGWLRPLEKWIYKLGGVRADEEMPWQRYFWAVLIFNLIGLVTLMALQMAQAWLPLNPQKLPNVPWALALNTAISFITNTNWQAYAGESTMSYFTQMVGLAVHNFLSAATGIAVLVALARGLKRASAKTLGSFWVDVTRATVYVLLPLAMLLAVALTSQGVVQNLKPYANATALSGAEMVIPLGPAASQIAIKHIGTNGGGFFGQNSAHPFENPTPVSNFLEMFGLLIVPASLVFAFGLLIGDRRHAWCLFGVMLVLLAGSVAVAWWAESQPNPVLSQTGPLLEGKETRFGVMNSVLFAVATTGTSCGAVNAMHDSFMPLAGMMPLWNIMLGCIAFGGVGAGLYGMLMHVLIAVFIAGLMVGRTPEYLGKKIQAWEATWAVAAILIPNTLILLGSAVACNAAAGLSSLTNGGPHGLSEIFYAFASASNNNGSAFAGLNANTYFYNLTLGAAMLLGRFGVIFAVLAIAGHLAAKKTVPASPGTFPTNGLTFACVLLGVIMIIGALTFFPALCLGPIVEHGLMLTGRAF